MTDFGGELQDDVGEGRAIGSLLPGLLNRSPEFLVDDPLNPFEPARGRQLLLDHLTSLLQGDHLRGQGSHPFQTLVNRPFTDTETAGGLGL